MKSYIFLLIGFILGSGIALVAAQTNEIPVCDSETVGELDAGINDALTHLAMILETDYGTDTGEAVDDITIEQRKFRYVMELMPKCVEYYTKGEPIQQVLDEYSIAYGLVGTAALVKLQGDDRQSDRLVDQAEKHVRYANRVLEDVIEIIDFQR